LNFRAEFFNLFNHPQFGSAGERYQLAIGFGAVNSTVNNPQLANCLRQAWLCGSMNASGLQHF
jgi:hypothetical protein